MRDRLSADQVAELAAARTRIAELEKLAARPPDLAELRAMTADQIADELERPGGRVRVAAALSGKLPIDQTRLADPAYLRTLSVEEAADAMPAITAALTAAKETPR